MDGPGDASREQRLLKLFVDHTPAAVAMFDRDMRYLLVSRRWLTDYQLAEHDILGKSHYDVFPEVPERWKEIHRRCLAGAVERCDEDPFERRDGRTDWVRWEIHPWYESGGTVGGIIMFTEVITERKRLEEQLRHTQKMESLGVLAGGIAHDFNNLLTGILGHIDLARLELPAESRARLPLDSAMTGAQRAAELAHQMLAYSGRGRFVVETLDLSEVVTEMTRLLEASVAKSCRLRFDLASDLPPVEADAAQLRQVVMNLILNASESMAGHRGTITIRTGAARGERSGADGGGSGETSVLLDVADTGRGMSEDTVERIFDPFFSTKEAGHGLGLSAVLGIVRGHRGTIRCSSAPGRGTTFTVRLPATSNDRRDIREDSVADAWNGHGTVLVVDDEESVREVLRRMVERLGFSVVVADDGQEGTDVFRREQGHVRLVLLDTTMPRLGGAEAFHEMRRIRPDVKVILMSGYDEQDASSRFTGARPAAFLRKPFKLHELQALVRRVLAEA